MIGAGGIGCELLKNLVLTGFGEVARDSAAKFNPFVKLEAHHANIKDSQFSVDWFSGFTIVFNALDNLDARRHVNKMCLAASVPLIESGTTGFNGQVQVIMKGRSECYDCNTKQTPKSFPVCTIRSTPSQPIHCIVWAKSYLFNEIFGTSEDEVADLDYSQDSENAAEIENLRQEAHALSKIRQSIESNDFPRQVFEKVFKDDINRLLGMEDMWKTRKPPNALDFEALSKTNAAGGEAGDSVAQHDQTTWSLTKNFAVFCDSLRRLSSRIQHIQASGRFPVLSFDKDDDDTLDFVAASANMRSIVFGIEPRSKFDIKQMAGNIIPAIATTNAMIAGLCILQAFKVMREDLGRAKTVFLERSGARVINSETLRPPNPNCEVCNVAQARLVVDPARATLNDLVEGVLKPELGYGHEFSINNEVGTLYDPELDDNLSKKFGDLGVKNDSFLTVIDDEDENPRVNLSLDLPEDSKSVLLPQTIRIPRRPTAASDRTNSEALVTVAANGVTAKRKRSASPEEPPFQRQQSAKRGKLQQAVVSNDPVVIEDSTNGAIVIDD
ncbi:MAG: hypothetical protein Q9214_002026 [Letrouitia sp. 1 TL-2023]